MLVSRTSSLVTLALLCSGCASIVPFHRGYAGPALPRDRIAVLILVNGSGGGSIYLPELDGQRLERMADMLELTPGRHLLCASWGDAGGRHSRGCSRVTLEATAGHTYELYDVHHTHADTWYPAVRDVTVELQHPDRQQRARWIVDVLNSNRKEPGTQLAAPAAPIGPQTPLPGSGEARTATITGKKGAPVRVEYAFDRRAPWVLADGADGEEYHLELSEQTGEVRRVLGTRATIGSVWLSQWGFQPLGSEYVVFCDQHGVVAHAFREGPPGTYQKLEKLDPKVLPPCPEAM